MFKINNFIFFAFLIFADQLSKYLIRHSSGFYICNKGIAFGLGFSKYLFLLFWLLAIIIIIFILISKFKVQSSNQDQNQKPKTFKIWVLDFIWNNLDFEIWISKISVLPLILVLSGAISNIIDRLIYGCIIDFIDLKVWPVFNLADVFITLGVILFLFYFYKKPDSRLTKKY